MSEPTAQVGRPRQSWWRRLALWWKGASRESLTADDELRSQRSRGTVPIAELSEREHVVVSGALQSITYSPMEGAVRLAATLYDGTGTIEVVWLGRRTIPGIVVGRHIEVEGTATRERDHLVIFNPLYRIVSSGIA